MQRTALSPKEELKRGAWTDQEDKLLSDYIEAHGIGRWRGLPAKAGLNRCGKSCRLRWLNYLRPGIKRGNITDQEEELIIRLHNLLGNRWSLIAGRIPGRTDNEIKNYWNTYLKKKISTDASSSSKITTTTTVAATTVATTSNRSSLENPSPEEPNKSKNDNSISNKVEFKSLNNSFNHEEENLTLTLGFDSLLNFNGHQEFGPGSEFSYGELHGGSILTGYEWRGGKGSEEIQASFAEVEWESLIKSCEAV